LRRGPPSGRPGRRRRNHRPRFCQRHQPVAERLYLAPPDRLGRIDQVVGELARHPVVERHDQPARFEIRHDQRDRAFYSRSEDAVHLPRQDAFKSAADYYGTALHELAHWSGHPSRLNRQTLNESYRFGDSNYADNTRANCLVFAFINNDTLNVDFYEADTSTNPYPQFCGPFVIPANSSRLLSVDTQCTLGPGPHFGTLVLTETIGSGSHPFAVFSRSQTPAGTGFSVEGVPLTFFGSATKAVDGLKRTSTAPNYLSNCFVAAPGEALDYRIDLSTGDGAVIGQPILGSLLSHHVRRHLDVLATAKAPVGDYTNVRATFTRTSPGTSSPLIGFCTMQESVTFGADFRIAK